MGPSVKFFSAIIHAFFKKKNGGQFFSPKKDQTGEGGRGSKGQGGLSKDHTFFQKKFRQPSPMGIALLAVKPFITSLR